MILTPIYDTLLDETTKGIPGGTAPFALKDIAQKEWNILREDLPFPLMLLRRDHLDHNAQVFKAWREARGYDLAPHGKTTMAPQIFAEQLRDGAWAMTAATVGQVQVMRHFGVARILMANQLLGKAALGYIAAELEGDAEFEFYCFLDSEAQLEAMRQHLPPKMARPIKALVEIGFAGARTGLRSADAARALIARLPEDPRIVFAGLATFEGAISGLDKHPEYVTQLTTTITDLAATLPSSIFETMSEFVLSGGGSVWFDMIGKGFKAASLPVPVRIVLRSGCYVTNDHGGYFLPQEEARQDPSRDWDQTLKPALEAWAYVQSRPEPGLAFLAMGKRDIPYDSHLPKPVALYRPGVGFLPVGAAQVFATNDQHSYVRVGVECDWRVGDLVVSGISHPCTAFDKWRLLPVVDQDYRVTDGVLTYF